MSARVSARLSLFVFLPFFPHSAGEQENHLPPERAAPHEQRPSSKAPSEPPEGPPAPDEQRPSNRAMRYHMITTTTTTVDPRGYYKLSEEQWKGLTNNTHGDYVLDFQYYADECVNLWLNPRTGELIKRRIFVDLEKAPYTGVVYNPRAFACMRYNVEKGTELFGKKDYDKKSFTSTLSGSFGRVLLYS